MLETDPSKDLPVSEELMIASRRSVLRLSFDKTGAPVSSVAIATALSS
jgi:hypothetical protein